MSEDEGGVSDDCYIITWKDKEKVKWINDNFDGWGKDIAFTVLAHYVLEFPEIGKILGAVKEG